MHKKTERKGMAGAIPNEAKGSSKAATWITRALRLLGRSRTTSGNETTATRPLASDSRKKTNEPRRLRQVLERSSISADSAYLRILYRRGLGELATKAGRVAGQNVNVRIRTSKDEPQRHMRIKHALSRNPRNTLVEMDYQSPIGEFLRRLDLEHWHFHFGLAPRYLIDQFALESTHLLLVLDDHQCVEQHHIPISVMIKAVML